MRRRDLLKAAPLLATPALARGEKPLRFIPQANLSSLDPIWTTAAVVMDHAFMVYDTLYGVDVKGIPHPQMCAGHEVSGDGLTWTFALREGLRFHDGAPVLARDCVASIRRWGSRDSFGQKLMPAIDEIAPLDDARFRLRLKKPFPPLLFGLGARQCFIMPERVAANTPGTEQIKDTTGSGPFRFLADEWVSGVRAAYAKFDGYAPRGEKPDYFSGGKVVNFERVEWQVQPDAATAAAALQKNEADWLELPLVDLCPMLRKSPGVTVNVTDPNGWMPFMVLNHLYPPFDNPAIRRALWLVLDQRAFLDSVNGDQTDLGFAPTGYFTRGLPMATMAGMEVLNGPRDPARARKMVMDAGYKGEKVVLMAPSDYPAMGQMAHVAREMFESMGLNVDYQVTDWGSMISRRSSQKPPDQGGWNAFTTVASAFTAATPGTILPMRGNGRKGWFGWPTDGGMEELRDAWFEAPDLATQRAVTEQIQRRAVDTVPFLPLGQMFQPTAFRSDIRDIVRSSFAVFWGVRRE